MDPYGHGDGAIPSDLLTGRGVEWKPPARFEWRDGIWVGRHEPVHFPEGGHDHLPTDPGSWWYRHRARVVLDAARRYAPSPPVLWDIGGGTGLMAKHFRASGWRTVIVEPVLSAAVRARTATDLTLCSSLADLELPERSLPAISLFDVIEHLDDPVAILSECRRVLAPGGVILITVPALPALWSDTDRIAGHRRRYTRAQIRKEAEAAGLECLSMDYFFGLLALGALPVRWFASHRSRRSSASAAAILASEEHMLQPPRLVQHALVGVHSLEHAITQVVRLPAGLSLLAVLSTPST